VPLSTTEREGCPTVDATFVFSLEPRSVVAMAIFRTGLVARGTFIHATVTCLRLTPTLQLRRLLDGQYLELGP